MALACWVASGWAGIGADGGPGGPSPAPGAGLSHLRRSGPVRLQCLREDSCGKTFRSATPSRPDAPPGLNGKWDQAMSAPLAPGRLLVLVGAGGAVGAVGAGVAGRLSSSSAASRCGLRGGSGAGVRAGRRPPEAPETWRSREDRGTQARHRFAKRTTLRDLGDTSRNGRHLQVPSIPRSDAQPNRSPPQDPPSPSTAPREAHPALHTGDGARAGAGRVTPAARPGRSGAHWPRPAGHWAGRRCAPSGRPGPGPARRPGGGPPGAGTAPPRRPPGG